MKYNFSEAKEAKKQPRIKESNADLNYLINLSSKIKKGNFLSVKELRNLFVKKFNEFFGPVIGGYEPFGNDISKEEFDTMFGMIRHYEEDPAGFKKDFSESKLKESDQSSGKSSYNLPKEKDEFASYLIQALTSGLKEVNNGTDVVVNIMHSKDDTWEVATKDKETGKVLQNLVIKTMVVNVDSF